MADKLDDHTLNSLTPAEREIIIAEDLLEDALAPESETVQARTARADRDVEEDEQRIDPTPLWDTKEPANAAERLASLAEEKAALISKFDYGEITAREYSDALEALDDRREDIRGRQRLARMASEQVENAKDSAWGREVERFMRTTGKDIEARGEPAKIAFDHYVGKITGDPANARLSDRAQLAKAHKLFLEDFGGSFGQSSSAGQDGGNRDFAALDRLAESDPIAYEAAIARMSDAELREYGL